MALKERSVTDVLLCLTRHQSLQRVIVCHHHGLLQHLQHAVFLAQRQDHVQIPVAVIPKMIHYRLILAITLEVRTGQ